MSNPLALVILAQGVFGLGFVVVAGLSWRARGQLRAYGARCRGRVITLQAQGLALIRFTTADGEEVITPAALAGAAAGLRPGARIRVLYDPSDPRRMRIDTSVGRGLMTAAWLLALDRDRGRRRRQRRDHARRHLTLSARRRSGLAASSCARRRGRASGPGTGQAASR